MTQAEHEAFVQGLKVGDPVACPIRDGQFTTGRVVSITDNRLFFFVTFDRKHPPGWYAWNEVAEPD